MIKSDFTRFALLLTGFLALTFTVHAWVFHVAEVGFFGRQIMVNYLFNYVLTLLFFAVMLRVFRKRPQYAGYAFLYSSLIKFVLFFSLIAPWLKMTGSLRSASFFSFYIPYLVCLIFELTGLIRSLRGK